MNVAFIPLRAGSKSIPQKNIKSFCGNPLFYWAVKALQDVPAIDKIVIATDDEDIKSQASQLNFPKVVVYDRDPANAQDTSSTEAVMLEYINKAQLANDDLFLLVQATNPFIKSEHVAEAIALITDNKCDSVLSCVRYKRFLWNEDGTPKNYDLYNRPRRQDFNGELLENGSFYISSVGDILISRNRISKKIGIYEMPEYSAYEIDEPDDWTIMEALFKSNILNKRKDGDAASLKKSIKLFLSDVDGVLTDAGMYYSESGDELKKFNTLDGMGFQLLREAGIKTGIITTELTQIVERRAKKLKVDHLHQGKGFNGKLHAAQEICLAENISLDEVAYIGDDINCVALLNAVGIAACPTNAAAKVKAIKNIHQLSKAGGEGVVREFIEFLLENNYLNG